MTQATYKDFVRETSTTTGTGTYSLLGAVTNHQSFLNAVSSGTTVSYTAIDQTGNGWEVGQGVVTSGSPNTLSRVTISESSNSNAAVSWSAGTRDVFLSLSAEKILDSD